MIECRYLHPAIKLPGWVYIYFVPKPLTGLRICYEAQLNPALAGFSKDFRQQPWDFIPGQRNANGDFSQRRFSSMPLHQKLPPILFIGCLSMLFAEVCSGASQTWFITGWGLLLTFPLYLGHVLLFLNLAFRTKRTSLIHLYLFGMIFGLYESWITKVLWAGYIDASGPVKTFLGVGVSEFPVLVFFWHPIMSFIIPILVYEILTGKAIADHELLLKKTARKTAMITMSLIVISTFIANGNKFNLISANSSFIGTILIISGLFYLSRKADLHSLRLAKKGFFLLSLYLVFLYLITFFWLLPKRIPTTILPFATIIAFYFIAIGLLMSSNQVIYDLKEVDSSSYSVRRLIKFAIISLVVINIACLVPQISFIILTITSFLLIFLGLSLFFVISYKILKRCWKKSSVTDCIYLSDK
ncbi:MAG TPA: hypothetical protein VHY08_28310 [Bacillota bacterium]|nr:hypothetical protein [Bacillota bacterium]